MTDASDGTPTDAPPEEHHEPPQLRRAESLVLVNTGNGKGKSSAALGVADTATEMRVIKHVYQSGIRAMKGIDY